MSDKLKQLRKYFQFEYEKDQCYDGKKHIAHWAYDEIAKLRAQLDYQVNTSFMYEGEVKELRAQVNRLTIDANEMAKALLTGQVSDTVFNSAISYQKEAIKREAVRVFLDAWHNSSELSIEVFFKQYFKEQEK